MARNILDFPIRPYTSETGAVAPLAADLSTHEIAVNSVDKKIYQKKVDNSVVVLYEPETGASVKALYEAEANAFTDAQFTKLASLYQTVINDTLVSTSVVGALSANQGKVLKDLIDGLGTVHKAASIAARDALAAAGIADAGAVVFVVDDGDTKWARYQNLGTAGVPIWAKIQDEDGYNSSLASTALGFTASPTTGTVTCSSGTDAVIPLADGTNSGLALPAVTAGGFLRVNAGATGYDLVTNVSGGTF